MSMLTLLRAFAATSLLLAACAPAAAPAAPPAAPADEPAATGEAVADLLATITERGILRISDVKTGREIYKTPAHARPITCAVFSPGGRRAIFGRNDGTVTVWQLPK